MDQRHLQTNQLALAALAAGDFSAAQKYFKANAHRFPNVETLNNLGVYYLSEGMVLKNGNVRNAGKLGIRYLQRALHCQRDKKVLANLAVYAFNAGDHAAAYRLFLEASQQKICGIYQYDLGVCAYQAGNYACAVAYFEKISDNATIQILRAELDTHPLLAYAFSLLHLERRKECIAAVKRFCQQYPTENSYEVFALLCKCGQYAKAAQMLAPVLQQWEPSDSLLSMIAECYAQAPDCLSQEHLAQAIAPDTACERFRQLCAAPSIRRKIYQHIPFPLPLLFPCGYYGCTMHITDESCAHSNRA